MLRPYLHTNAIMYSKHSNIGKNKVLLTSRTRSTIAEAEAVLSIL